MCFQPSPSSPIHKIPISRRAEVRSLLLSPSSALPPALLLLTPFCLRTKQSAFFLCHKYSQNYSDDYSDQWFTCLFVLLRLVLLRQKKGGGEGKKKKKENLQAERIKSSMSDMDIVTLRNNMRENGKSSKTCCHSQLSHMRGWRQSLSPASLLQSRRHTSARAAPCCLFNLSAQAHFKNTKRNVGQRSPSSGREDSVMLPVHENT